ncbi:MAG: transposase [Oscillospiraceae bacterium]|nr:transposase [Oscillospiraceae bacterium]
MPRQAREFSNSGYLHLILRGIGRQILFEDQNDYYYFLLALERFCKETDITLCAYCLMDNHVHLLVRDTKGNTPLFMKKLGVSYAGYYNRKYDRTGHLFQDRYRSEAIDDDGYLLTVFRYILNNPQKAGVCPASEYKWSSFTAYDGMSSSVDVSLFREMIGDKAAYLDFLAADDDEDGCMEFEEFHRDDDWAKETMTNILGTVSGTSLQQMEKSKRNAALKALKDAGLTVRQIERLTGINRNVVQRV